MNLSRGFAMFILFIVSLSLSNAQASIESNYSCADYIESQNSVFPATRTKLVYIRLVIDGFVGAAKLYSNDRRIIGDMRAFYGKVFYYCRQNQGQSIIEAADSAWRE